LDTSKLPDIGLSFMPCGEVSLEAAKDYSLPAGIPVTGGLADLASSLYGSGTGRHDLLAMISSSGQVLGHVLSPVPANGAHVFANADAGFYCLSSIPAAGLSFRWIKNQMLGGKISFQEMDGLGGQAAPCEILFAPYLQGTGSPYLDVETSACFAGLRERHTSGDLIRAIMEGVVFSMKQAAQPMQWSQNLCIAGGGGSSLFWRQIFADVFQCPV
jgi:xylulokinase